MANISIEAKGGTSSKNLFTQDVGLYMIDGVKAAQNDTITVTDAKFIKWAVPCVVESGFNMYAGTSSVAYASDPGQIKLAGTATGTAYVLAYIETDPT